VSDILTTQSLLNLATVSYISNCSLFPPTYSSSHDVVNRHIRTLRIIHCAGYTKSSQAKLYMFYKIINNFISVPSYTQSPTTTTTHGHSMRYTQLAARTNAYLYSFFPSIIKLWNSLPDKIVFSPDFDCFKSLLDAHLLNVIICKPYSILSFVYIPNK